MAKAILILYIEPILLIGWVTVVMTFGLLFCKYIVWLYNKIFPEPNIEYFER